MNSSRVYNSRHAAARRRRRLMKLTLCAVIVFLAVVLAVVGIMLWPDGEEPAAQAGPTPSASTAAPSAAPSRVPVTPAPREAGVAPGDGTFLDPADVDRTDPDAVATAAATLFASHDTLLDGSEESARWRAKPLLDPALLEGPFVETPSPGAAWLEAQQHDGYTSPKVTPLTVPALEHAHEGETEAEHAAHEGRVGQPTETAEGVPALGYEFDVHYRWGGRDGWTPDSDEGHKRTVRLALVDRDGKWTVAEAYYGQPVGF